MPGLALALEQLAPRRCFAWLWSSGSTAGSTAGSKGGSRVPRGGASTRTARFPCRSSTPARANVGASQLLAHGPRGLLDRTSAAFRGRLSYEPPLGALGSHRSLS